MLVEKTDRLYRNLKGWATVDELDVEIHFPKEGVALSRVSRSLVKADARHQSADGQELLRQRVRGSPQRLGTSSSARGAAPCSKLVRPSFPNGNAHATLSDDNRNGSHCAIFLKFAMREGETLSTGAWIAYGSLACRMGSVDRRALVHGLRSPAVDHRRSGTGALPARQRLRPQPDDRDGPRARRGAAAGRGRERSAAADPPSALCHRRSERSRGDVR